MDYRRISWLPVVIILLLIFCMEGVLGAIGKIVSGRNATVGEFPYQVSIHYFSEGQDYGNECGGSIIDEHHVLTAAHCVADWKTSLLLIAGVFNMSDTKDPNRINFDVDQVYVHEKYDAVHFENDIALLRVKGSFPTNSSVIRSIAVRKDALEQTVICTVTGWGSLYEYPSVFPDILQAVDVPFISQEECVASYKYWMYTVLPGMMCAGYKDGGRDACSEDSGGPMVCDGELTGIVSWGNGCAEPNYPGVYTDVAYYYAWIEQTLATSGKDGGL